MRTALLFLALSAGCSRGPPAPRGEPPPPAWKRPLDFRAQSLAPAAGGHAFIAGREFDDDPRLLVLACVDALGEEVWRRRHAIGAGWWVADAAPTLDGGCVVVGGTGGPEGQEDIFALRFDAKGEEVWRKSHGGEWYDSPSTLLVKLAPP
jgi:hypothetical protein